MSAQSGTGNRNTIIIIVVVVVLLCCCCLAIGGGYYFYVNGDKLLNPVAPSTRALLQLIA
jgi:hypothetical protein